MEPAKKTPTRRKMLLLALILASIPVVGWLLYLGWWKYRQERAEWRSFLNCESDSICAIEETIRLSSDHLKRPLTMPEVKALLEKTSRPANCPESQLPYQWSDETQDLTNAGIAAWDPKPHEAPQPFRNVVQTDGVRKRMFESDFEKLLLAARRKK